MTTKPIIFTAVYDFTVDGGAIATITPAQTEEVPQNFVVTDVFINEITNTTSGGAATLTMQIGAVALTGAIAVASIADTRPTLASSVGCIPITTAANITVAVAAATLTAGKFMIAVQGFIADLD